VVAAAQIGKQDIGFVLTAAQVAPDARAAATATARVATLACDR
jgi:hypothetical protein